VPRRTLLEAAHLAAYYSQARGQRGVAVHYTLGKYVRKPKGGKPGLATITQEKTIYATPDAALVRRLAAAQADAED
jgi:predicted ribosome quality control (RQC) complex YloA/Tae2 family protein